MKTLRQSLKSLAVCALVACGFAAGARAEWAYESNVLTEKVDSGEAWQFDVTATDFDLTLQRVKTKGDNMVLDLNTPIDGGYKIRSNVMSTSLFQKRAAGWVDEIILPKTMTSVASWSFEACKNTITIPEDNEIEVLNAAAFSGSYLTGRVVLPKLKTMNGGDSQGPFHNCSRLYELDLGPDFHVSANYGNLAKQCGALTNLTARGVPFTILGWSMQYCTKMNTWTFYCKPTLEANWNSGITMGKKHRLFVKRTEASWQEVLQSAAFTPWASESCDKDTYFANFGADAQIPLGYTTDPFAAYILEIPEQKVDGAKVLVAYSPSEIGAPDPDYGEYPGILEATTFTVPQYSHDGVILHESTGYDLATWQDDTWVSDGDTVAVRSWTFTPVGEEYKRIMWNWREAGYQVDMVGVLPDCSVTTSAYTSVEGYVAAGSTLTLTANGEGFSRWCGVPEGVDATQRTISFVVTQPLVLSPYFGRDWQYDASAKTLDDGYWTISVTANGDDLTLQSLVKTYPCEAILDLDKPVTDNGRIVSIAMSTSLFQKRGAGFAKEIILPKTLVSVAGWAFENCYNTITIPEDNAIEVLNDAAFTGSYLTGRVVLPKLTTMKGGDGQGPFHSCSRLYELDLGPDIHTTASYGNLTKSCGSITNLTLRADSFTIKGYSMQYCSTMNTWTFNCYPTLEANWASGISFGKHVRLFINKANPDWQAMLKSDAFTPWASESCDQATYFANFGEDAEIPLGYTTQPFAAYVLKTMLFAKSGMKLIFR